jgi:ABC-2 type transport system permease protein
MNDFRSLRIIDLFRPIFERFGIDYPLMRKILAMKLTMDKRRVPTIFNNQGKKKQSDENNGFNKSLGMYALIGIVLVPVVLMGNNFLFQMSIFFGIVMFLVMTSMIADFSNVLLDTRDQTILLTKPVGRKTISTAKTLHIIIYLFLLTGAITAASLIAGSVRYGLVFLLLAVIGLILMNLLIVVITAFIYFFILRFFDGEKLKDIINYVQIGLTITITIGYQIVARSFSIVDLNFKYVPHWWHLLLPPIWFGAPFEMFLKWQWDGDLMGFSSLALLVPIIAMVIYIKMMPSFERNLMKLSNNSGKNRKVKEKLNSWLPKLLCRSNEEIAFYRFSENMMRNEREFRLKVYPTLGMALIFPFIFMFNEIQMNSYESLRASKWYLAIYMCNIMIPTAVSMLKFSGKYKGAWIYKTAPLKNLVPLYSAVIKVFIIKLFLPVYLLVSAIFIGIFGIRIIPDIFVVFTASILYTVISSKFLKGALPFSESFADANQGAGLKVILSMVISAIFFGLHFGAAYIPYGVFIYLIVLVILTIFLWKRDL